MLADNEAIVTRMAPLTALGARAAGIGEEEGAEVGVGAGGSFVEATHLVQTVVNLEAEDLIVVRCDGRLAWWTLVVGKRGHCC